MRGVQMYRRMGRNARAARLIARSARDSHRPLLAQIVPMRRCNLACAYCNEYDHSSLPVPLARLARWLDALAALKTAFVTCSGGEPLLHPHIEAVIRGIRTRGMIPGLMTNAFLLTVPKIQALNDAGLDYLQVSIDNVEPDAVSRKSLRQLDRQLESLAAVAHFDVNVNAVLGGGTGSADDVRAIGTRARHLGFSMSVGVVHDAGGRLKPLSPGERDVWEEFNGRPGNWWQLFQNFYSGLNGFQRNLVEGRPNEWRCRAGARYLYISEDGLVGRCSQYPRVPGIPIERYGPNDVQREQSTTKDCAPFCTIGCVHRASTLDGWLDMFRRPRSVAGVRAPAGAQWGPRDAR
jgi:MoaA/NifB/PqqE/SkfB family radical SAM enzyme